ncbi:MAG: hypothetical protein KGV57_05040 [Fusobacterium sp.]|nr:hypothetical protein [Fusobacterium sp.]
MLKKILLSVLFIISIGLTACSSAEVTKFLNEVATYETDTETARTRDDFRRRFERENMKETQERDLIFRKLNRDANLNTSLYKKGKYIKKYSNGKLAIKASTNKKNIYMNYYYNNGNLLRKGVSINRSKRYITEYYKNGKKSSENTPDFVKLYYKSGKLAMVRYKKNGKEIIYHKDGRVFFINGVLQK